MTAKRKPVVKASKASRSKKAAGTKKAAAAKKTGKVRAFRLDPTLRPTDVDVHVNVNPQQETGFDGTVSIMLRSESKRRKIELHAIDLRVSQARVHVKGAVHSGKIVPHPERETIEIQFPEELPEGATRLELSYAGKLRSDLCGLYGASVDDRKYAFTQLEASDARKFFPCFDEPAMKARFRISVTTAARNTVLSNNPEARVQRHDDGRKTVHFERTPLLSSYLVALAVGELECSEPTHAGPTEIRIWHIPGKGDLTAFALEAARETLGRLEDYFDIPYPYEKLDLVAVPDFEFGAMENAGAVFFRETLLLTDPHTVTLAEKKRAAEVICHELAHMWYGDLVTMAWWDDLWLNEAFATWMAYSIVDQWKPEWNMWHEFQHHRSVALSLDSLRNTHPIYATVRTPDEANANFDTITYEKGASVVQMIERYLGFERFREGVRHYIARHRESNAVAADLWHSLGSASGEDVERVVRTWIEEEGYPVVSVRRRTRGGREVIELTQERFTERPLPKNANKNTRWAIPWVGRLGKRRGETRELRHLITLKRDFVDLEGANPEFIYGNAGEGGFFRPLHGLNELREIGSNLASLSVVERVGLVDHQWALVRAQRSPLSSLLDLITSLAGETDPDVLMTIERPLTTLVNRLAPEISKDCPVRLRRWIREAFGSQWKDLGWEPRPNESDDRRVQRARILSLVGSLGREEELRAEARDHCHQYLEDRRSLEPNLADIVISIAAGNGDEELYGTILGAMRDAHTPQEQRRFLMALGDFSAPSLIDRTLQLILTPEVATQDVVFLLYRLLENSAATERTWVFTQKRWTKLSQRMPDRLAGRLLAALPLLGTRAYRTEVSSFFKEHPLPSSDRLLRQALERFDWWLGFHRAAATELESYLEP